MNRNLQTKGQVSAISYPGQDTAPMVSVHLDTETGTYLLHFQSRRELYGVAIGDTLLVSGSVVLHNGVPVLFNPEYEILAK
ncbi:MAG: hypothetical protein SPG61_05420 [Arcanobacterium sp.]|nr:hypothetical protein [Arcanobacterium sp.]